MNYDLIRLSGSSTKTYDFELRPYPSIFDSVGAVYFVEIVTIAGREATERKIIYMGATDNLAREFSPHPKAGLFTKHGANFVLVLEVANAEARTVMTQTCLGWRVSRGRYHRESIIMEITYLAFGSVKYTTAWPNKALEPTAVWRSVPLSRTASFVGCGSVFIVRRLRVYELSHTMVAGRIARLVCVCARGWFGGVFSDSLSDYSCNAGSISSDTTRSGCTFSFGHGESFLSGDFSR